MAGNGAANGATNGGAPKEKKRVLTKNEKKRLKKKAEREEKRLAARRGVWASRAAPPGLPRPEEPAADGGGGGGGAAAAEEAPAEEEKELSKKQRKAMSRMTVAELKQMVARPEVVEAHDVTAGDPKLLVYLKSYRNAVPVPRHWCHKRKYLQGKRGVEKKPWQLPEFIAQTGPAPRPSSDFERQGNGIEKIRKAVEDANAAKAVAAKSRERVQPKMGRMDVDYQVLHDAFFKWQTKPPLSGLGEIYYEGKEFEVHLKEKKPGSLSASLKAALGMPDGAPPPWLINMQRYGPPPSYPNLRIPGLNAPIPEGASFGYHPGGWGKPPVDEYGRPLYGDVFGARGAAGDDRYQGEVVHWGELGPEEPDDDESEDEGFEMAGELPPARRRPRRDDPSESVSETSGIETPLDDGISSAMTGLETPDAIDLRKRAGLETPDSSGISSAQSGAAEKQLYKVIDEEKSRARAGGQLFASDKRYKVGAGVDAALDPDALEGDLGDQALLKQKYDAARGGGADDDVGDVLADGVRNMKRKLDKASSSAAKKQKDFKF
ncbi:splicing factor 3B [Aureococcus anophagefferens]|uniref:Splicing factor 3B n=2 Tax=Aureococcus anophagefferens TaxID=44056 RepID=A0ABR1G2L6_AURAN